MVAVTKIFRIINIWFEKIGIHWYQRGYWKPNDYNVGEFVLLFSFHYCKIY